MSDQPFYAPNRKIAPRQPRVVNPSGPSRRAAGSSPASSAMMARPASNCRCLGTGNCSTADAGQLVRGRSREADERKAQHLRAAAS
jgi:hypothetical protein